MCVIVVLLQFGIPSASMYPCGAMRWRIDRQCIAPFFVEYTSTLPVALSTIQSLKNKKISKNYACCSWFHLGSNPPAWSCALCSLLLFNGPWFFLWHFLSWFHERTAPSLFHERTTPDLLLFLSLGLFASAMALKCQSNHKTSNQWSNNSNYIL